MDRSLPDLSGTVVLVHHRSGAERAVVDTNMGGAFATVLAAVMRGGSITLVGRAGSPVTTSRWTAASTVAPSW